MNKKLNIAVAASVLLFGGVFASSATANKVDAKSFSKAVTKIAGNGNYAIYHNVSKNGPSGKFTSTAYFKHGQIQSKRYVSTKKGNFWDIYVNGRHVGWVSQNFFARNQISVANDVTVQSNSNYSFPTRDAINYATDSQGTAVDPSKVQVSQSGVSTKSTTVNYSYGKAKASVNINVVDAPQISQNAQIKNGFKTSTTWTGSSKSSSRNWNAAHHYTSETTSNTYSSNGLTLKTRLFQPRFLSLGYGQAGDAMGQVGVIPEGITVNGNQFVTSLFTSSSSQHGHLAMYNLNAMNKFAAQNLTTMGWSSFKSYSKNIKVSPYIKLGHGQSLGSSDSYIYVMANDNKYTNGPKSEEILQIRKSDMKINKIWTFAISSNRYIHNATFSGDGTMYALFRNGGHNYYEYWRLDLQSNGAWKATQVGATQGRFISNSPVQGFAYGKGSFFIGFNDNIYKVSENGTAQKRYHFNTRRELEGLSVSGSTLYAQLAQRAELLSGKIN